MAAADRPHVMPLGAIFTHAHGLTMNRERIERWLRRWERTRAAGLRRFVIVWGVVGCGIPAALLFSALVIGSERQGLAEGIGTVVGSLMVFPVGGIFVGYWTWGVCERLYRVRKRRLTAPEQSAA